MDRSLPSIPAGVVVVLVLVTLPLAGLLSYFLGGNAEPLDYTYVWIPIAILLLAAIGGRRHGRNVGFTTAEYSLAGIWATGVGLFVGISVTLTLAVQLWKGGRIVDLWFVVSNWTLTGTALGAVIGLYDGDRRVRIRHATAATTRNRRLVQQLSVLNRVLRHDVRTAVNVIDGYATLVEPADEQEANALERIRDRAAHLTDISEHARILQDLLTAETVEPVDVGTYLADRLDVIDDRNPLLTIEADVEPGTVATVPPLFTAALDVALDVAVEHNVGMDAELHVACRNTTVDGEDCVEVEIGDNGTALTEMERVVYESPEESPLKHSSGIDLWLVKWAVEQADGEFQFEADTDWNRMTVHLPAA